MRNYIYELVLVEDEIIVTEDLKEPPLLRTCKQIRKQAGPIWYMENTFTAEIYDCDAKLTNDFEVWLGEGAGEFDQMRGDVALQIDTSGCEPHWQNLRRWCERIHGDYDVMSLSADSDATHMANVISTAHHIARSLREQDWLECYFPLHALRMLAGNVDPRWLIDHDGEDFWD